MKEYIERASIMETLTSGEMQAEIKNGTASEAYSKMLSIVNFAPAADVVSVVRCRDCEYYENSECVCPYIWMSDGAHIYTQYNDFCSYGKRRVENAETD